LPAQREKTWQSPTLLRKAAAEDAPRTEDKKQRIGTIGAGDGVFHASPMCDVLFELRHLRTQNPLTAFDGGLYGFIERFAKAAALGL